MRSSWTTALLFGAPFIPKAFGHGFLQGIVADGVYYSGYDTDFQFRDNPPDTPAWQDPGRTNQGPVGLGQYTNTDIICSLQATNGKTYAKVAAGGQLTLQWNRWPSDHEGPIITYLASCNGDCTTVDKTTLLFNKIDASGLINGAVDPASFATDTLLANNISWSLKIPASIAPGRYVLRHEIIALHLADKPNMAENYPQCVNLEITGAGTNALAGGTLGTELYTTTDPGLNVDIYNGLTSYSMPGPPLMQGSANAAREVTTAATTSEVDDTQDTAENVPVGKVRLFKRW